jgi:hypothetical protein
MSVVSSKNSQLALPPGVRKIIDDWIKEGDVYFPPKTSEDIQGEPLHPEFVYRKKGTWKGWNKYLNKNERINDEDDYIENLAWCVYKYENP